MVWKGLALASPLLYFNLFMLTLLFSSHPTGWWWRWVPKTCESSEPCWVAGPIPLWGSIFAAHSQVAEYQRRDCETLGKLLPLPWVSVSSFEHDDIIRIMGCWSISEPEQIKHWMLLLTHGHSRGMWLFPLLSPPHAPTPNRAFWLAGSRGGTLIYFSNTVPSLKIHL